MSWNAIKVPLFVGIGLAAPGLVVLAVKNVPPDLIVFRKTEIDEPRLFKSVEPVTFTKRGPVTGWDPFRSVLPKQSPRLKVATVAEVRPPVAIAPVIKLPPVSVQSTSSPNVDLPDPQLEGVVGGDNPVAVLKIGEESQFVRIGQNLGNGLEVLAITDGEVRLKRGNSELVLKTGIR